MDHLPPAEDAELRRLVKKWIDEDLTDEELARLPVELKERVRTHFRKLIDEGIGSAEDEGWIDGPRALAEMRQRLAARRGRSSFGAMARRGEIRGDIVEPLGEDDWEVLK